MSAKKRRSKERLEVLNYKFRDGVTFSYTLSHAACRRSGLVVCSTKRRLRRQQHAQTVPHGNGASAEVVYGYNPKAR